MNDAQRLKLITKLKILMQVSEDEATFQRKHGDWEDGRLWDGKAHAYEQVILMLKSGEYNETKAGKAWVREMIGEEGGNT